MSVLNGILRKTGLVRALEAERQTLANRLHAAEASRDGLAAERDELKSHLARLETQAEEAWAVVAGQRTDLQVAEAQRDALEQERDGLREHVARLDAQREGAEHRLIEIGRRVEAMEAQRDALEAERDALREHTERLRGEAVEHLERAQWAEGELARWQRRTWVEPGHFYSPLVNPVDPQVRAVLTKQSQSDPASWSHPLLDDGRMLDWLERLAGQARGCPFPDKKTEGHRYYFDNPAYSYGDAITLFAMLREIRPRRVVEVGSGYSSAALLDTREVTPGVAEQAVFIEPYPETLWGLLAESDPARALIRAEPLQSAPIELFTALEENDLLFIDSSHILKTGSDVHDYLFRILPALKPGVWIHIHDIFFPFEYPPEWIDGQNRSWNEAYGLHAFLAFNRDFRIEFFNDYVYRKFAARAGELIPASQRSPGGSLWIRRMA